MTPLIGGSVTNPSRDNVVVGDAKVVNGLFNTPPIDPKTGLLAPDPGGGRLEYFVDGTQPKEVAPAQGQAQASDFFVVDPSLKP